LAALSVVVGVGAYLLGGGAGSPHSTASAQAARPAKSTDFANSRNLRNGTQLAPLAKGETAPTPTLLPLLAIRLTDGTYTEQSAKENAAPSKDSNGRGASERAAAEAVAASVGGQVRHSIGSLAGWWLLEFGTSADAVAAATHLAGSAEVDEALVQHYRRKQVRTNDTFFNNQWHLKNTGQGGRTSGLDLNVEPAWLAGWVGTGIRVAVVDDGVDFANPDLSPAHFAAGSFDFEQNNTNPSPKTSGDDHGTACAGLVGARANNIVGVAAPAYGSSLSGLRLLASNQSDATEASALTHMLASFDIYTNSWGPSDTGDYEATGPLARNAILNGVANGRNGRGAIYVWAGGNGGSADNANYDGYANMPETISVAAITGNGVNASYSEYGDCHLVAGMAGNSDIVTTDRVGSSGYNYGQAGNLANQDYTNDFAGTSAATPMVAGVIAQILQAKPTLTWRDVQHILVRSSERFNPTHSSWQTNAAGYKVSHRWGFGLVDSAAATALATQWLPVAPRVTNTGPVTVVNQPIPESTTPLSQARVVTQQMYCEHVQVKLTLDHSYWGDLVVDLVSPQGTVSNLAFVHGGHKASGFTSNQWTYMTVHSWGEPAAGTWTLRIRDGAAGDAGYLTDWQLIINGTPGLPGPTGGTGIPTPEDVSGDGSVDVVDVQFVVNLILGFYSPVFPGQGDVNLSGTVDVVDVQRVVNKILNP